MTFLVLATSLGMMTSDVPSELSSLLDHRAKWMTGEIVWVDTRCDRPQPAFLMTQQFTQSENLVTTRTEDPLAAHGTPSVYPSHLVRTHKVLSTNDGVWAHTELSTIVESHPPATGVTFDHRSLGLWYTPTGSHPNDLLLASKPMGIPVEYSVFDHNGFRVVEAIERESGSRTVWKLDPRRGNQPVQITHERAGNVVSEAHVVPRAYGENWFPERVEFYSAPRRTGDSPCHVIQILSFDVNSPAQPQTLTLEDIGVDSGFYVQVGDPAHQLGPLARWNGRAVVSDGEYRDGLRAGHEVYGPRFEAVLEENRRRRAEKIEAEAAQRDGSGPVTQRPASGPERIDVRPADPNDFFSEWRRYTEDFIVHYELKTEQAEHARLILTKSEELGREYVRRVDQRLKEFEKRHEESAKLSEPARTERLKELASERRKLLRPLDDIFETRLKPGLEKIPTREQRRRVAEREAAAGEKATDEAPAKKP